MKKDYSKLNGKETSRLLKKELFYVRIDKVAAMTLREDYTSFLNTFNGEAEPLNPRERHDIYVTIYDLLKLYKGGNRIELILMDDVLNLHNLIHRHIENINDLKSSSINPIVIENIEGLADIAMLADELFEYNKGYINDDTIKEIERKQTIFKSIGFDKNKYLSKLDTDNYGAPNKSQYSQEQVMGNKVRARLWEL